jgi:hypothetical protein
MESKNPQFIYQSLLAETDEEAKSEYAVDPRVVQFATRNAGTNPVETFQKQVMPFADIDEEANNKIVVDPEELIDSLAVPVQNQPPMIDSNTIVIIDTAQRDWTLQPDIYNINFSFTQSNSSVISQLYSVPYYYNNSNVPLSAYDSPQFLPNGTAASYNSAPGFAANSKTYILPSNSITPYVTVNQQWQNTGLLAQTWGWRLVYIGNSDKLRYIPDPIQATDRIVYFPAYDPVESRGALIGTDVYSNGFQSNTIGFGTQLPLSNVKSVRLVRATLPLARFDAYSPSIYTDIGGEDGNTTFISYSSYLNTFQAEPYIIMNINDYKGKYYGAGNVIQNAFTALVQQQRTIYNADANKLLSQYQDYYPWSKEAYTFDTPLGQLSNAAISLSNNAGQAYTHLDDLKITTIIFGNSGNIYNISNKTGIGGLGMISLVVTRDVRDPTIVLNPSSGGLGTLTPNNSWIFPQTDMRQGDRMFFYPSTIQQIQTDSSTNSNINNFFSLIQSNGMIVSKIGTFEAIEGCPILDAGYLICGVINVQTVPDITFAMKTLRALTSTLPVFNITDPSLYPFILLDGLNYLSLCASGQTWQVNNTAESTYTLSSALSSNAYYPLPIMNLNQQCTFALEVVTSQADTTQLKKIIPN